MLSCPELLWPVLGANVVGFVVVLLDKAAARRGARRWSEAVLVLWAALGGWPLMLLGMLFVRHKTRKPAFLFAFVVASAAATVWVAMAYRRLEC